MHQVVEAEAYEYLDKVRVTQDVPTLRKAGTFRTTVRTVCTTTSFIS